MIFQRAVRREFANTAAGVFVALLSILLSTQLIRLLGQAAGGKLPADAVVVLLGFSTLNYLPTVLSLTVFISVLLSLSRAYRDSEMIVWSVSGLPLTAWIRPVMGFAAPVALVIAILSILVAPWATGQAVKYRQRLDARHEVSQIAPGAFRESAGADRVFFVESLEQNKGEVKNVFVSSLQNGRLGVMVAALGRTQTEPNGDRFLILEKGRRYEGSPGSTEYRVMEFERYALRIQARELPSLESSARQQSIVDLVDQPSLAGQAEILWRIGLPLSALTLALIAIPLSYVNPRAGRASNLIFAILVFMVYANLLSLSQAWLAQGRLSFAIALLWVHLGMMVWAAVLFWRRSSVWRFWKKRA